jgi:hypothetical protein
VHSQQQYIAVVSGWLQAGVGSSEQAMHICTSRHLCCSLAARTAHQTRCCLITCCYTPYLLLLLLCSLCLRVGSLQTLQSQHDELEKVFRKERAALEEKYAKLYGEQLWTTKACGKAADSNVRAATAAWRLRQPSQSSCRQNALSL